MVQHYDHNNYGNSRSNGSYRNNTPNEFQRYGQEVLAKAIEDDSMFMIVTENKETGEQRYSGYIPDDIQAIKPLTSALNGFGIHFVDYEIQHGQLFVSTHKMEERYGKDHIFTSEQSK